MKVSDIIEEIKRREAVYPSFAIRSLLEWIESNKPSRAAYWAKYDKRPDRIAKKKAGSK